LTKPKINLRIISVSFFVSSFEETPVKYTTYAELAKVGPLYALAVDEAEKAAARAYNPYSGFYVGAALFTADRQMVSAANFENASYGAAICAERAAVVMANAMGLRSFCGIAIIGKSKTAGCGVIAPCGICRQVLYELSGISGNDLVVVLSDSKKEKIIVTSITELLPLPFSAKELGLDISMFRQNG
jgi:cytidine deaminase